MVCISYSFGLPAQESIGIRLELLGNFKGLRRFRAIRRGQRSAGGGGAQGRIARIGDRGRAAQGAGEDPA